jgi:hypothetical protein
MMALFVFMSSLTSIVSANDCVSVFMRVWVCIVSINDGVICVYEFVDKYCECE